MIFTARSPITRIALLMALSVGLLIPVSAAVQAVTTHVAGASPGTYLCNRADYGCTTGGYSGTDPWGYWRYGSTNSYGYHNCTAYAAFKLAANGAGNPGNLGNASDWANSARSKGIRVDGSPAVGSIAQFNSGHVAYVEEVGNGYIVTTDDNYGYNNTTRQQRTPGHGWPDNFIHLADVPQATNPDPPSITGVSASTSGNPTVSLSWSTPNNNGAGIQWYDIRDNYGDYWGMVSANQATLGAPQIVVGKSYQFSVRAYNGYGTSSDGTGGVSNWSAPSGAVTPITPPGAPALSSVTPSNGSLAASWSAPASNGGSVITGYTATASPGGAKCTSSGTRCTISGLTNGTSYSVTVTAQNAAGSSAASNAIPGTPAPIAPGAPQNLSLTSKSQAVVVSWAAPASDGGSPITTYNVTSTPGTATCTTATLTCTLTGLTNGTAYAISVVAVNAIGRSTSAEASATPYTTPSAPTGVSTTVGNGQVAASWTAPANGGSAITSYLVSAYNADTGLFTCTTTTLTTCTVTGLTNGTPYSLTVVAINAAGRSKASTSLIVTPHAVAPSSPNAVAGTGLKGVVAVTWSAPTTDGGSPVLSYKAVAMPGSKSCTSTGLTCSISGLTNGSTYAITVVALNQVGTSAPTTAVSVLVVGVPTAPQAVQLTSGNQKLGVTWTAPTSNGGAAISGYTATATPGGATCTSSSTSCTISGLTNGTAYQVVVTASNAVGASVASSPATSTPRATVPSAPVVVQLSPNSSSIVVTWTAPTTDGGSAITSYVATASGGRTCSTASGLTCTITGLTNGASYSVTVIAKNAVGSSVPSNTLSAIPTDLPGAPTGVTASAGDGRATVSWLAVVGTSAAKYTVTASPGGSTCTYTVVTPEVDSCVVTGLSDGTVYTFTVVASNAAGSGSASKPSSAVTPVGRPGVPPNFRATDNSQTAVRLGWDAPTANGSSVDAFTVKEQSTGLTCSAGPTSGNTCVVSGLNPGSCYQFQIQAHNGVGWSDWSGNAQGCTQSPPPPPQYGPYHTTIGVNVRSGPGTGYGVIGGLGGGATFYVSCQASGTNVNGNVWWDRLTTGGYISDYYTTTPGAGPGNSGIPAC